MFTFDDHADMWERIRLRRPGSIGSVKLTVRVVPVFHLLPVTTAICSGVGATRACMAIIGRLASLWATAACAAWSSRWGGRDFGLQIGTFVAVRAGEVMGRGLDGRAAARSSGARRPGDGGRANLQRRGAASSRISRTTNPTAAAHPWGAGRSGSGIQGPATGTGIGVGGGAGAGLAGSTLPSTFACKAAIDAST